MIPRPAAFGLLLALGAAAPPPARVVPLVAEAWAGSSVNVLADQHSTLFSHGERSMPRSTERTAGSSWPAAA